MAFDPDEYLKGSAPTPTVTVEPAPPGAETVVPQAAPVSGFDPDAYLKSVSGVASAAPGAAAPSGFDPDKYLAGIPSIPTAPKETGIFAEAKNYIKNQADILGADLKIGAINTGIAVDNLKLAGLMELQETRKAKYGDNLDAMPADVRKDHIATGKAIEKMMGQVAQSSMKIREVEKNTGVRETTKAFNDIRQTPEYQAAPFMTKAQMVGEKFIQDPVGIITDLGLQSLPQSLGVAATAIAARVGLLSPTAAAIAGGTTSAMMEFGNQYAQLREEGMSHKEAWEKAGVKSGVIGMFDGASFKLAGSAAEDVMKNISKGAFKETAKTVAKETGVQAGLGAAGEAASSVAIGKPIDPGEVLAEAVGEVFGAPGEAVSTYRSQNVPKAITPTAPGAVTPAAPVAAVPITPEAAPAVPPSEAFKTDEMMAELNRMKTEPISAAPLVMPEKPVVPEATTVAPEAITPTQTFENIERPQIQTPQFQQWFGDSKVKDESGKPKVMYHSTYSDFGVPKVNYGTDEYKQWGFHVGTTEAAESRLGLKEYEAKANREPVGDAAANIMPVFVKSDSPLRLDENRTGRWGVDDVMRAVMEKADKGEIPGISQEAIDNYFNDQFDIGSEIGVSPSPGEPDYNPDAQERFWNDAEGWQPGEKSEYLKAFLQQLGYDSIVYDNKFEGGGDSYILFNPAQVKSATGNQGTFNPESGNISENFERLTSRNSYAGEEATRAPSLRVEMNRLSKQLDQGKITHEQYAKLSQEALNATKKEREFKPRVRGMDQILSRIRQEVARKKLDPYAADFAEWFLRKNPSLADDLGISIKAQGENVGVSGTYADLSRIITLFKGSGNPTTAVHEILHHTERMMPEDIQSAIRESWLTKLTKAQKAADKSKDEKLKEYFKALIDYHLEGDVKALKKAKELLQNGSVDYDAYQYINPSEYWAVNATNILDGRYEATNRVLGRLKQWLKEFLEFAKSSLGLANNNAVLQGLKSILASDGKFLNNAMLYESRIFESIEPPKRKNYKGNDAPLATWSQLPSNKYISDSFIYNLQDRLIDTKRVIQAIKNEVKDLSIKWDTYAREILYHGRASDVIKKFLRYDAQKAVEKMQSLGLTMKEVQEYLLMRHAPAYNESIAEINPSMPDAGSSVETAVAEKYMKDLPKDKKDKLKQVAKDIDAIIKKTQQILVDTGQEPQEKIDGWNKRFPNYVPLHRDELDFVETGAQGTGQGFSIRGAFARKGLGSKKPVQDIFSNVISQFERAVGRGEKNLVLQSLYGLAIQNPSPDFWLPINPDAVKSTKQAKIELAKMGISPTDVDNLLQEPMESYIDPKTGIVGQRLKQSLRDSNYALPLRIEGKQRFLILNPNDPQAKRMVLALKNMDLKDIHAAFSIFSMFTRWFVGVNTQYNPFFGIINFLRDVQGSAINLSSTALAGKQKEVIKRSFANLKPVYQALRRETRGEPQITEIGKQFADMQAHGGQTGYRDSYQQKREQHKIIEDTLAKIEAGPAKKALMGAFDLLTDLNDAFENAVRLAVYQTALENKLGKTTEETKDKGALLAKTISVNFNKRGASTQEASALWGFFNSSIQGTARTIETLRGPAGKKIIAGGLALGGIQALALALAGFDDDQPPPFVRDKNLIIPIPGTNKKYVTIPMPFGLNILPNLGRTAVELMLSGGKDAGKKLSHVFAMIVDSFNPLGGSESLLQMVAPTALDPLAALKENRDAFGRPIAKLDRDSAPSPGHTRAKDTASAVSKELSRFLNFISGGNEDRKGAWSPTPDQIDYVIGQVTGGIGRELLKIEQSASALGKGEEVPPYKIPVLGRFYGDAAGQAAQAGKFYDRVTQLSQFEREIKGRTERREGTESIYRDHPEARLWRKANRVENEISDLNKRKRDLIAKNAPAAQIKQIEELKKNKMATFNKEYESATK